MNRTSQIIILGAGASKSDGMPLQSELFEEFMKKYSEEGHSKLVVKFFKDFWGISKSSLNSNLYFPSFEESLGILDWAHVRGESFKGYTEDKIDSMRNALTFLIAKVIDENLKPGFSNHLILIKRLLSENSLEKTAFISLNYDVIIDKVLSDLPDNYGIDYGIEFASNSNSKQHSKEIKLYKLHGSLNWLYCSTCSQIKASSNTQKAVKTFYEAERCSQCETPMKPVIVPPTLYKEMTNPFIQQLFLKCDHILKKAEKIFFCGYSFPESDMHIKYLLKRAELFNNGIPEIHIINYHDGKSGMQEEEERFRRFFRDKSKLYYHSNLGFEEFAKRGI